MSGPTGVRGGQGPRGIAGVTGAIGIPGMMGPQGAAGVIGVAGSAGIAGSTGIHLYGNGSLIQCGNRNTTSIITNGEFQDLSFNNYNPPLSGITSTTISGQYDASGLSYYGNPLQISDGFITIPAGKYFISSTLSTTFTTTSNVSYLQLSSYSNAVYTAIAGGIAANPGSDCHLQHYYTPSQDTTVAIRLSSTATDMDLTSYSDPAPSATLSIVKIW